MANKEMASELEVKSQKLLIPKRVTIETIYGCNAKCGMCPIQLPPKRKKGIMPLGMFKGIIDSLVPYKEHFGMMDLYGLGEPLLDPYIFDRVKYAKEKSFSNIGFSTNADLLDFEKQKLVLESGIDTVIFSIDGIKKETHEGIRVGVNFERVIENCLSIIKMRNEGDYGTRFVIRFIRQDANRAEWDEFKKIWSNNISKQRNDFITAYDVHSWSEATTRDDVMKTTTKDPAIEKQPCYMIFDILYILSDGRITICSEDWYNANYSFGNAADSSPIDIFNCDDFNKIRQIHQAGKKNTLDICRECTVLYSIISKEVI